MIAVVVESLRDIPEMTACRAGLEHVLDEDLAGLGQAVSDLGREFVVQPVEVQKRVAEVSWGTNNPGFVSGSPQWLVNRLCGLPSHGTAAGCPSGFLSHRVR